MVRLTLHLILLVAVSSPAVAQRVSPAFQSWTSAPAPEQDTAQTATGARLHPRDYRYEGLIFGGVAVGALGAWVGSQLSNSCPLSPGGDCGTNRLEQAVALGLVGAVLGGGTGYLIGRLSPKRPALIVVDSVPALVLPDSVRVRVGYRHWKGAAVGTAAGMLAGGILALVANTGCDDCTPPTTGDRVKVAAVITAGGGVLGFLAGLASPRYQWVPREDITPNGADLHQAHPAPRSHRRACVSRHCRPGTLGPP